MSISYANMAICGKIAADVQGYDQVPPSTPVVLNHIESLWKTHQTELEMCYNTQFVQATKLKKDIEADLECYECGYENEAEVIRTKIKNMRAACLHFTCSLIGILQPYITLVKLKIVLDVIVTERLETIKYLETQMKMMRDEMIVQCEKQYHRLTKMLTMVIDTKGESMKTWDKYLIPGKDFSNLEELCQTIKLIQGSDPDTVSKIEYQIKISKYWKEMLTKRNLTPQTPDMYRELEITIENYRRTQSYFLDYIPVFERYLVSTIQNVVRERINVHVSFYLKDLTAIVMDYTGDELISYSLNGDKIVRLTNLMTHLLGGKIITQEQSMELGRVVIDHFKKYKHFQVTNRVKVPILVPDLNRVTEPDDPPVFKTIYVFKYTYDELSDMMMACIPWIWNVLYASDREEKRLIELHEKIYTTDS